jgi:hypothetical protein
MPSANYDILFKFSLLYFVTSIQKSKFYRNAFSLYLTEYKRETQGVTWHADKTVIRAAHTLRYTKVQDVSDKRNEWPE